MTSRRRTMARETPKNAQARGDRKCNAGGRVIIIVWNAVIFSVDPDPDPDGWNWRFCRSKPPIRLFRQVMFNVTAPGLRKPYVDANAKTPRAR